MLTSAMQKLRESLSCVTYSGEQQTNLLIKENDKLAKLTKVTLEVPSGDWFSINPDDGRKCQRNQSPCAFILMSPLLAIGNHEHHRACDCVIVINKGKKSNESLPKELRILYIDLKSRNPSGYVGQFKSTRQFMRYALGLLEEFHGEKLEIRDEKYFLLKAKGKKTPLGKQSTTRCKGDKFDDPRIFEVEDNAQLKNFESLIEKWV